MGLNEMARSTQTALPVPSVAAGFDRTAMIAYFDQMASERDRWIGRNRYYHRQIANYFSFYIPPGQKVLEIGSGTGELLCALRPSRGVGIDISPRMTERAAEKYPHLDFHVDDIENLRIDEKFDYVILSDLIGFLHDVQKSFEHLRRVCTPRTRIVISYFNFLWEPVLQFGEKLGMKARQPVQNWLGPLDIENLLGLAGFEAVRRNTRLLLPKGLPIVSTIANRYLVNLPLIRRLGLVHVLVARLQPEKREGDRTVSVVIPCRNERGNVEAAVQRTPELGAGTEIIFVEGGSQDDSEGEIRRVIDTYPDRRIRLVSQGDGRGKGDAVRKGFAAATGDILMILDGDLTVEPEELPKFYDAIISGRGELVHGSRLVYPMEKEAMRTLNRFGNKFFSVAFSYLLEQRFKDTLCGTKVLLRRDYEEIAARRARFGDFDPFGDFDLLFGAAALNLKIIEIPIHYRERTYGSTQISRFRHGWLLLRMSWFAMRKLKFI